MSRGGYQRRFLRAPLKEPMLFADGPYVLKARTLNISEDGLLIDELPSFPQENEVPLMISLPLIPHLKDVPTADLLSFSQERFERKIFRAKARIVRKVELSQNLENIFKSKFGLQFVRLQDGDRKVIESYVSNFSSNLVHLQTLIDSFNADESSRVRSRTMAEILGYEEEKISQLRSVVAQDYQSLQWL